MDDDLRRREHENWGRAVNRSYGWVQTPTAD
jgi:glycerol kinase